MHSGHGGRHPRGVPDAEGAAEERDAAGAAADAELLDGRAVVSVEAVEALDRCDAYVVLVADPVTGALDSYGPLPGAAALSEADRRRRDLDAGDLPDVDVRVVRHHLTTPAGAGPPAVDGPASEDCA